MSDTYHLQNTWQPFFAVNYLQCHQPRNTCQDRNSEFEIDIFYSNFAVKQPIPSSTCQKEIGRENRYNGFVQLMLLQSSPAGKDRPNSIWELNYLYTFSKGGEDVISLRNRRSEWIKQIILYPWLDQNRRFSSEQLALTSSSPNPGTHNSPIKNFSLITVLVLAEIFTVLPLRGWQIILMLAIIRDTKKDGPLKPKTLVQDA